MDATVRAAVPEDYPAICGLMEEVDAFHARGAPDIFRPSTEDPLTSHAYVKEWIGGLDADILVADTGQALLGYAVVVLKEAPDWPIMVPRRFVVVDNLGVTAAYRHSGIGRHLMQAAEDWARQHGATSVELSVHAFNRGAIDFYLAIGYETAILKMRKPVARR